MDCWDQDKRSDGATDTAIPLRRVSCQPGKWTHRAPSDRVAARSARLSAGQLKRRQPRNQHLPREENFRRVRPIVRIAAEDATMVPPAMPSCIPGIQGASSLPPSRRLRRMYLTTAGYRSAKSAKRAHQETWRVGAIFSGKFTDTTGNSSCHICTFGSSSVGSTHPCTECPTGKFSWYDAGPSSTVVVGTCLTLFDTKISSNAPTTGADGSCAFATSCFCCPGGQYGQETSLTEEQIRCAETSGRAGFRPATSAWRRRQGSRAAQLRACPRGQYADDAGRLLFHTVRTITSRLISAPRMQSASMRYRRFSPDFSRCQKCATGQYWIFRQ